MNLRNRLGYDKNRPKQTYKEGTPEFDIAELAYELFLELTQVAYAAINRAYTKIERDKNPKTEYLWAAGHAQAKEFLTRYKNNVRDGVIPLVKITRHKEAYDDSQDQHTQEFKKMIVDGQYYTLHEKLRDFGPMMLPEDQLEAFNKVLDKTYEVVKTKLVNALANFEAEGRLTEKSLEGIK